MEGAWGEPPPPPPHLWDNLRLSNTSGIVQKKKSVMPFLTGAPSPKTEKSWIRPWNKWRRTDVSYGFRWNASSHANKMFLNGNAIAVLAFESLSSSCERHNLLSFPPNEMKCYIYQTPLQTNFVALLRNKQIFYTCVHLIEVWKMILHISSWKDYRERNLISFGLHF